MGAVLVLGATVTGLLHAQSAARAGCHGRNASCLRAAAHALG